MSWIHRLSAVLAVLAAGPAWSGLPPPGIIGGSASTLTSPAVGLPSATQTITLTFDANGVSGGSKLTALTLSGANATDFAIVGGTCAEGDVTLGTAVPTCTVIVRYTPSSAATETAQLNGICTTATSLGGFTLLCTNTSGALTSLTGSVLAAVATASAPLLDPKLLTILCAMLVGIATCFVGRKPC